MKSYLKLITDLTTEPINLAAQKVQCQIDASETAYDTELTQAISASRHAIEQQIGRQIGEQQLELGLECWPCDCKIEFPRPPLIEVLTIKYTKQDGSIVTWYDSASSPLVNPGLIFEPAAEPGAIFLKFDKTWPTDILANGFPIKIRFKAGVTSLTADLKHAILMMAAHLFLHRETINDTETFEVAKGMEWLYKPYVYEEMR